MPYHSDEHAKTRRNAKKFRYDLVVLTTLALQNAHASVLSEAVADCTTFDNYCELSTLAPQIPFDLVDSGNGHNILEYAAKGVWSGPDKKLIFFGEGHLSTPYVITYSENANSWSKTQLGVTGEIRHSYSSHAIDPAAGMWYYKDYATCLTIRRFSITDNSEFSPSPINNFGNNLCYSGITFFPEMGKIILVGLENGDDAGVMAYLDSPSGSGTWNRLGTNPGTYAIGTSAGQVVYDPVHKLVLFGGTAGNFWKIDATGNITQLPNAPCSMHIGGSFPILSNDPATGDTLLLCGNGATYAFDPDTGSNGVWTQIISAPPPFFEAAGVGIDFFGIIAIPSDTHQGILFLECGGTSNCRSSQKPRLWFLRHGPSNNGPPDILAPTAPTNLIVQ